MSRRIELELTSARDDGTWTWRAAGAKQPKGELDASLLPEGAAVGDVLRADADFHIDGIEILTVQSVPERKESKDDVIEVHGSGGDESPVRTRLAPKSRRRKDDRRGRGDGPRRERQGERRRGRGDAGSRAGGDRPPPKAKRSRPKDDRPKPKRLRPQRVHRKALLESLSVEERPIAEQLMQGGVPAVRQAVERQNAQAKVDGRPEVNPGPLVDMAEKLLPAVRAAEWRDRADASLASIDELDLRDIRSVVNAAEQGARDEESRAIAEQLRTALTERAERDHQTWLTDLTAALNDDRLVRALRLSSRPPKAGTPLPSDLRNRLQESASAGLTGETGPDRYATVVDALAFSPVHQSVAPQGVPTEPGDQLLTVVKKHAVRVPLVAEAFSLPAEKKARPRRRESKPAVPPPPAVAESPTPEPSATAPSPAAAEPTSEPAAATTPTPEPPPETPASDPASAEPASPETPAAGVSPASGEGANDPVVAEELG